MTKRVLSAAAALSLGLGLAAAPAAQAEEWTEPAGIEVAFVLDTTGSMGGLIAGAKRKILSIANNLMDLEPRPDIKFALIGYRDRGDAYVTKRFDLTEDVQAIYGELQAFRAGGGGDTPESVNQALREAVAELSWSRGADMFRVVFLVGDAPPKDYADEVPYPETLALAAERGIIVNAIQAGAMAETSAVWREIAALGDGDFVRIAQDGGAMAAVDTPYDAEINELYRELNDTVLPYGGAELRESALGKVELNRAATAAVAADAAGYFSKRGKGEVLSGRGDLVQDLLSDRVTLKSLEEEELPEEIRALAPEARAAELERRAAARTGLQSRLDALVAKRDAHIEAARSEVSASADEAFDQEVERIITRQAGAVGYKMK